MRCAAAELVIANAMVEHIFTDIYVPNDHDRQKALSSALELLNSTDPHREALVRCQLLESFSVNDEDLDNISKAAFREICNVLDNLLPAGDPRDKFHTELNALLGEAIELWRPLQRSKTRVSAHLSISPKELTREDDAYRDYDLGPVKAGSQGFSGSQPVMLLFPLIYASDQDLICTAMALWSDQGAFIEASNEASEDRFSMAGNMPGMTDSARPSAARRRFSVSGKTSSPPTAALPPASAMHRSSSDSSSHLIPTRSRENGIKLNGTK